MRTARPIPARFLLPLLLLLAPALLEAHAGLRRSDPKANASLRVAPDTARLWFTERPELALTTLRLVSGGDTVALAPVFAVGDSGAGARLPKLPAGRYVILWRTTSADGHPRNGRIPFTVTEGVASVVSPSADSTAPAPAGAPGAAADEGDPHAGHAAADATDDRGAAPELAAPYVAVRWLSWVALFLVLGAFVARAFVLPRAALGAGALEPATVAALGGRARRVAMLAGIVLVAAVLLRLAAQWWALGIPSPAPILATTWGRAWVAQLVGALLLALLARRPTWGEGSAGWVAGAVPLLLVVVGFASTGHAAAAGHRAMLWILADALHLAAAASWIGTLLVLGFAAAGPERLDRGAQGVLLTRFSPVGLVGSALAVLAGLALAVAHVGTLAALAGTDYGRFLIRKVVLVLLVASLGFLNWRVFIPRLARGRGSAVTVRLETTIALVVLALTAVLVALPAPTAE